MFVCVWIIYGKPVRKAAVRERANFRSCPFLKNELWRKRERERATIVKALQGKKENSTTNTPLACGDAQRLFGPLGLVDVDVRVLPT